MKVDLYPHQESALQEMRDGCILKGGVGTGKSRVAIAYFFERVCGGDFTAGEAREFTDGKDLYVITTAKKRDHRDWEAEAAPFSITDDRSASFGGVTITVDSWNNVVNYTEVEGAFFVFDEQRLVGNGAWVKAFYKIAAKNQWIILSATPGDNWMDYIPVFVANGYFKNRTDFIRQHVVYKSYTSFPKIDRFVGTQRLERLRSKLVVDMPYERHTRRHVKNILVKHDTESYARIRKESWNPITDEPILDAGESTRVERELVNSDPARIGAIMELLEKHPRLIVFYNFNYELNLLRTLAQTLNYPVAEWNGHKHQAIPDESKWLYLVQYTAGAEGWNCTSTDAMVFYSLNYSYKINEQAKGRIERLNTKYNDLYYYILYSSSYIDQQIRKALVNKKDFNERKYSEQFELAA